jgi:hypothetical protein
MGPYYQGVVTNQRPRGLCLAMHKPSYVHRQQLVHFIIIKERIHMHAAKEGGQKKTQNPLPECVLVIKMTLLQG